MAQTHVIRQASNLTPHRLSKRPILILALASLACLLPFVGKAFNVDDPLFLWAAQQIQSHPLDFYGFSVNWVGTLMPMPDVMFNPPLTSYFIALVAAIAGWKEVALHLAFLVPALAVVSGSYLVAKAFCRRPLLAALSTLFAPAFLVSATSVMSDVMMLAFWVWAIYFWIQGLDTGRRYLLVISAVLIGVGTLTKYFCISLVPLLFVYTLVRERRFGGWAAILAVPLFMLLAYELLGMQLYGKPLFITASHYSSELRNYLAPSLTSKLLVGLSFVGGGTLPALLFAPLLWSRRELVAGFGILLIIVAGLSFMQELGPHVLREGAALRMLVVLQLGLFIVAGLQILVLAVDDLKKHKDALSLMLFLWIGGTLLFSVFFNWSVNARTILPMAPAVGILIMRRIEHLHIQERVQGTWRLALPLAVAAGFGMLLSWSDYRWANSGRTAAKVICNKYHCGEDAVWFAGHGGFQYYMQRLGAIETDWRKPVFASKQKMVLALNSYVSFPLKEDNLLLAERFIAMPWKGLATMNRAMGAGYYWDQYGPLPFAVGRAPPDEYLVFELR